MALADDFRARLIAYGQPATKDTVQMFYDYLFSQGATAPAMPDRMDQFARARGIRAYTVRDYIISFGPPPLNTLAPSISGAQPNGSLLTASPGTWTGYPAPTFTYQWLANGVPIGGATASTYTTQAGEVGQTITVVVSGSNATQSNVAGLTSNGIIVT